MEHILKHVEFCQFAFLTLLHQLLLEQEMLQYVNNKTHLNLFKNEQRQC